MFISSYIILGVTVLLSLQGFKKPELIQQYAFNPYKLKHEKNYYRLITHAFFHGDMNHLIFNMFSFYFVGRYMESVLVFEYGTTLGEIHFLAIYFGGTIVGTIYSFWKHQDNPYYQSIGASGAISASIFAFILWLPNVEFLLFFFIPMKAFIFGFLYLAIEYFSMKRNKGGIAHDVHIISAIYGVIYILIINFEKGREFIDLILRTNG